MRQLKKAKCYITNSFNCCAIIYNHTVVLSLIMKLILLVLVLLFCFISNADGLECYECLNSFTECKQTKITTCGTDESQKHCVKVDLERTDIDPLRYCNGNCIYKGCIEKEYEKFCESGTFNITQAISVLKGTAYCCEGNLCNSANKVYNKNTNDKTLRNQTFVSSTTVSLHHGRSSGTTNVKNTLFYAIILVNTLNFVEYLFI